MNSDRCAGYYCVACPHGRFCSNEDEMFNRLVESTKYHVEKWGLYWIDICFEEQDRVARNAFDRYREWLKHYGFTGRELSYKKYINYCSDTLEPCYGCGCYTGTFYFKPIKEESE